MLRPRGRRRVWQFLTQTHIAADNDESLAREVSNEVVRHMKKLFAVTLRILIMMRGTVQRSFDSAASEGQDEAFQWLCISLHTKYYEAYMIWPVSPWKA